MLNYLKDITFNQNLSTDLTSKLDNEFSVLNKLLDNINFELVDNNFDKLLEITSIDKEIYLDCKDENKYDEKKIFELLNSKKDDNLIKIFDDYIENVDETPRIYYNYHFGLLDENEMDLKIKNINYTGKGVNLRFLLHFQLSNACLELNIVPQTYKTNYIMNQLNDRKTFGVKLSNDKLKEKESLINETLLINTLNSKLNTMKSSINLNKLKIDQKEEIFNQLIIRSLKNLDKANTFKIDRESLIEDYEKNLKPKLLQLKLKYGHLTEEKISHIIYLIESNNRTISKLTGKQKLITFLCILVYLNDNKTLNDKSINKLFLKHGEKEELNIFHYFCRTIRDLIFSKNTIDSINNNLRKLKEELVNENFDELLVDIINQIKELIKFKENTRTIIGFYITILCIL